MSRVIVKNLPKRATDALVRDAFEEVGQVTDVKMLQNQETGQPRGVAFVGFRDPESADKAIKHFKKAYIGTCKVTVELARPCRDPDVKKWGKQIKEVPKNQKWEEFQSLIHGSSDVQETAKKEDLDSSRLFLRNLPYTVSKEEIETLFQSFGPIEEVLLPMDSALSRPKGYAYVKYANTEAAVEALTKLDGTIFQGRLLHILPAFKKPEPVEPLVGRSSFKTQQLTKMKTHAQDENSWNTLFLNQDAVASAMSKKLHLTKGEFLDKESDDLAVRLSLAEAKVLEETKEWMQLEDINISAFQQNKATCPRSKRTLLIKNLPTSSAVSDLQDLFGRYGAVGRLCIAPSHTVAIVEYANDTHAQNAFEKLAFAQYKHLPLYLEYAPIHTFTEDSPAPPQPTSEEPQATGNTVFIKNLNFSTEENAVLEHFRQAGEVKSVRLVTHNGLPCGYGFVEYGSEKAAEKSVSNLNNSMLDGHALKVAFSKKAEKENPKKRKAESVQDETHTPGTKILIKNLPFEATKVELRTLFQNYGQVKTVRIPKKYSGGHRGFAFVDFVSQEDAESAFTALQSAHLYGRKLCLQWAEVDESVEELRKKVA